MKVYLLFVSCSEDDRGTDVLRVFRSKSDADSFCSSLKKRNNVTYRDYFVETYDVF